MWLMFTVLIVSWVHGCIGLYFWLRMKARFKTAAPLLLAAAVLIPTLAMLGLYQGGRSVVHDSGTAQWKAENLSRRQVGTAAEQDIIDSIVDWATTYMAEAIAGCHGEVVPPERDDGCGCG